jgi:predicted negative regulator of RcsB-dependent stress response
MLQLNVPIVVGPVGTAVLLVTNLLTAVLLAWRWWKSTEAEKWQATAAVLEKEAGAHRQKADRLDAENRKLIEDNARLSAATDLSSLQRSVEQLSSIRSEEHKAIMEVQRDTNKTLTDLTKSILGLQTHMAQVFDSQVVNFGKVTQCLDGILEKLR